MLRAMPRSPVKLVPGILAAPLGERALASIAGDVRARLRWQRTLGRWPAPLKRAPNGTPYVSLYEGPTLRGCFGDHEGGPRQRLARAFLRALHDDRFGGIAPLARGALAAEIAYMHSARFVTTADALARFETGTHGVGLVIDDGSLVLLLPAVARDNGFDANQMLDALAHKARRALDGATLFLFEVSWVAARDDDVESRSARAAKRARATPAQFAAAWLERLVQRDGSIVFAIDPRRRTFSARGELHHARTSVVIRALERAGDRSAALARARRRLARELGDALRGAPVEGWPDDPSAQAGTIAHAVLAGVDLASDLRAFADARPIDPWFAGQVALALGNDAPKTLWMSAVANLDARPWAPWTLLAARARSESAVVARTAPAIARSLREEPPHVGGCGSTRIPETALTALAIESLAGLRSRESRSAVGRGRRFLERVQLVPGRVPAALDPTLALGGLPASPLVDLLRCDVVGHALLALSDQ